MTLTILQIILGIIGLATTVFVWWVKKNDVKVQEKDKNDKDVDAANDSSSLLKLFGRLRGK